ncbi:MAG: proteasome assembly chaperone family protein [Candidatus Aenigmatarchaeota archaeon]|nr:MAG: proteasome assembly chaperone family protein [Candidatus Aenigmarchaeota archaeon]RLJ08718.1 MAG: proteasome assembly chaperone family protein [Candidatus Aenigmarchaeota archaeon]RLJ09010.1 MAG: proteasome assembly chaperone family protein [Candidatus Aenigmarchaeota archaeon]
MTKITEFKKPKLNNPILIEGLPGVGNIGRVAVGYLLDELKAEKFAQLYSKHFFPFVVLQDENLIHLLKNEFYYWKAEKKGQRDLVFLVGDCQSLSPQGHYEIIEKILDYAQGFGVKEIYTVGGMATGEIEEKPEVIGAVTHKELLKKYDGYGIKFEAGKKIGYIVGAAGLLLGLGAERGMKGMCLLGETSGFPIVTDPKAAEVVLESLTKILNVEIDMTKLERKVKEMEKFIKKIEELQKKALTQIEKHEPSETGKEQLRYIG